MGRAAKRVRSLAGGAARAVLAAALLSLIAATVEDLPPEPSSLVGELGAVDPARRASAEEALRRLGDSARDALAEATDDDRPAVAQSAKRLLMRLDLGADRLSPLAPPDLLRAAAVAGPENTSVVGRAARVSLAREGEFAAPLLAKLLMSAVARDELSPEVIQDLQSLHIDQTSRGVGTRGRPAVVAELVLQGEEGVEVLQRWLAASRQQGGPASLRDAVSLVKGAQSPDVPGEAEHVPLHRMIQALVQGHEPPAEGDSFEAATASLAVAITDSDPARQAAARAAVRPWLTAGPPAGAESAEVEAWHATAAVAALLLGDLAAAEHHGGEADPVGLLGYHWMRGDYERFESLWRDDRWDDRAGIEPVLRRVSDRMVSTYIRPRGRSMRQPRYEAGETYKQLRLDLHEALATGRRDEAERIARQLVDSDPAHVGWRRLLAAATRDEEEARRLTRAADLMPLEEPYPRMSAASYAFAYADEDRELVGWSADQWRQAAAWGQADLFRAPLTVRAAAEAAEDRGEWHRAAELRAALVATVLRPDVRVELRERLDQQNRRGQANPNYLSLPIALQATGDLHHALMNLALVEGDAAEARRRYDATLALQPLDVSATIDYVRHLDATGQADLASDLFANLYRKLSMLARANPTSALLHNQTAWLAARCGRRLDSALDHAKTAVNLNPQEASYLDTLAEVHAARGEAKPALEMMATALDVADEDELPLYLRRRDEVRRTLDD